jgi:CheY-like chemotaxis protein
MVEDHLRRTTNPPAVIGAVESCDVGGLGAWQDALGHGRTTTSEARAMRGKRDGAGDAGDAGSKQTLRVLVYSDRPQTRDAVTTAVGTCAAADLAPIEWVEVATHAAAVARVEQGGLALLVLDGETGKAGGIGLCRQLEDEVRGCPPVLVLLGRPEDRWLASSADPDAMITGLADPMELQEAVVRLLRASARRVER